MPITRRARRRLGAHLVVIVAMLATSFVATPSASADALYEIQRDVVYSSSGQTLDLFQPLTGSDMPIAIFIHGGGWNAGDKIEMWNHTRLFAENNMVALTINYRSAPEFPFPSQFNDVVDAIAWAKENAPAMNANPDKIILIGVSSGGNLALLAGLHPDVRVKGIVSVSAPVDLDDVIQPEVKTAVATYMGPYPRGYGSPINLVSPDDPTTLILHGSLDFYVRAIHGEAIHAALIRAGVNSTLRIYEGAGHGLMQDDPSVFTAAFDMLVFTRLVADS